MDASPAPSWSVSSTVLARKTACTLAVESPGGISPPGAPRSVREPLDSHGSRCSAVSMAQLPMSEERRICAAKAARPADDIEVNPLQGRTQLRSVEVALGVHQASK